MTQKESITHWNLTFVNGTGDENSLKNAGVTVIDGHPHSLAWLGAALKTTTFPLGVSEYGQSGDYMDLYKEYGIDSGSIAAACFGSLGM